MTEYELVMYLVDTINEYHNRGFRKVNFSEVVKWVRQYKENEVWLKKTRGYDYSVSEYIIRGQYGHGSAWRPNGCLARRNKQAERNILSNPIPNMIEFRIMQWDGNDPVIFFPDDLNEGWWEVSYKKRVEKNTIMHSYARTKEDAHIVLANITKILATKDEVIGKAMSENKKYARILKENGISVDVQ